MRVIERTSNGSYLSAGIFTWLILAVFIVAYIAFIVIALLTIGIVVYVLGSLWTGARGNWHGWNRRWARFLRVVAGQPDAPAAPEQPEEAPTEFLYHDDGIRMV